MPRPEEPTRHRAMVEGGITRRTYWRTEANGYPGIELVWADSNGVRYAWDDIDARRIIFDGEDPTARL